MPRMVSLARPRIAYLVTLLIVLAAAGSVLFATWVGAGGRPAQRHDAVAGARAATLPLGAFRYDARTGVASWPLTSQHEVVHFDVYTDSALTFATTIDLSQSRYDAPSAPRCGAYVRWYVYTGPKYTGSILADQPDGTVSEGVYQNGAC